MNHSFTAELPVLPFQLGQFYTICSTYKWDEMGFTCLVKEKENEQLYILKYYTDPLCIRSLVTEKEILNSIHSRNDVFANSFPRVADLICQEDAACFIRDYIPGQTLEEITESNMNCSGMDLLQALDYVISTLELLDYLHSMETPIIHRDIKPQNIVIDQNGRCHFIDMGISRFYQKGKVYDTDNLGTRLTAPPEQFGYQQTDIRSDLYSVGILLFYCLTGEYTIHQDFYYDIPDDVMNIIQKATRFDPEQRYHDAASFMSDLLLVRYSRYMKNIPNLKHRQPVRKRHFTFAVVPLVIVTLANILLFLASLHPEKESAVPENEIYTFKEPLLEEAVRMQLNLSVEEPIYVSDLDKITEIHILGQLIYSDESEIWYNNLSPWVYDDVNRNTGLHNLTGTISSLDDILYMPNLKSLFLGKQQIRDISVLQDTSISELGFAYNPLSDLTVLENNPNIETLNLSGCDMQSLESLSGMSNLSKLTLTATDIHSLEPLEFCPITTLELYDVSLDDYEDFQYVPNVTTLAFHALSQDMVPFLEGLPLEKLTFLNTSNLKLSSLNIFPDLQELYCGAAQDEILDFTDMDLPGLRQLTLNKYTIHGFTDLEHSHIEKLLIYGSNVINYNDLDKMPYLREISCTKKQAEEIKKQFPDHHWTLWYPES